VRVAETEGVILTTSQCRVTVEVDGKELIWRRPERIHGTHTYKNCSSYTLVHSFHHLLALRLWDDVRDHFKFYPNQETHVVRVHRDAGAARGTDRRPTAKCEHTYRRRLRDQTDT
jgi:hypothetical protein